MIWGFSAPLQIKKGSIIMKVYCVFENNCRDNVCYCYLYRIFSTKDKAIKAIEELNRKSNDDTFYDIDEWEAE